jgi:predicted amidohydrolase YtcJ
LVYRNGRTHKGEPIAFEVVSGRFKTVDLDIDVPHAVDLRQATVLPGFIDAHCHIMPTGFDLFRLNLSECGTHEDVLDRVRDRLDQTPDNDWLLAVHYDQNRFDGIRHMSRDQLDAVSTEKPILLRHVNGHASVANTAALVAAGVTEQTQDPKGGVYVRDATGRLTGVLLERAHEHVSDAAPAPTLEQRTAAAIKAADEMSQFGITCASDMMTGYSDLLEEMEGYWLAAQNGAKVRFRLYLQWSPVFGPRAADASKREELTQSMDAARCKVAGAKIFADGAVSAGTAAIYGEFKSGGNGNLIYDPERLTKMTVLAHEKGWPVSVHSIGDRATDHVLDAFEATGEPSRHRIEHAMLLSDAQVARLAKAGCHTTMQPEFLARLGHAYMRQLDTERASKIKRARSCLDAGIRMSFNSDRPIVLGDPWVGIHTATNRPEGFDPAENVTPDEAIDLYTRGGADANGDLGEMGELKTGQHADFQLYKGPLGGKPDAVYMGGELMSGSWS